MATWNRDDSDLVIGTGIGSTTIGSNLTISNNEIDCASGDLLLDAASDLILDADSSNILLKDNGVLFGSLNNNSSELTIKSGSTSAINLSGANTTLLGSLSMQPVSGDGSNESFLVVDTGDNIVKKRTGAQVRSDLGISDSEIIDWTTDQGSTNIHVNNVLWESGQTFDNDNQGLVPNPGSTGTTTRYLREDGYFQVPPDTNTQLSTEQVQDIVGDMFHSNTETRINAVYNDTDGKINLLVDDMTANTQNTTTLSFVDSSDDIILRNTTGGAGSGTDDIKFVAGSNITLTHTDADNITIASANTNQLTTFTISDGSTDQIIAHGNTLTFAEGEGINVAVSATDTVTVTAEEATTINKGVAAFSQDNFSVSSGTVTIKDLGVATAELDNRAVTYAKMQNVTADRILGRITDGGSPTELTAANVLSLIGVEAGATADQTQADINGLAITEVGTITSGVWNGTAIAHAYIGNDAIEGDNLADNAVDSEHYTDGSIDHVHLSADAVDGDNIADDSINSEHYVDGSIDTAHIADDQVTYAKIQNVSATDRILGRDSAGAGVIEEITPGNLKTMLSLNNVENTALSTFAGTSNITTLGTIATGTWNGTAIGDSYISSASTWNSLVTNATHTGDVTGATSLTIADDAVTYAKMQNMSDNRILGRYDEGDSGVVTELNASTLKTMLAITNVENTALSTWAGTTNITTLASNLSLGGSPTTTTQSAGDDSTKIATTAYVETAVSNLVDSAPGTLNTLNELAAALGDDASFSTTVTNSIATKAPLASPTFTGTVTVPATIARTGDLTFDISGDITLDADGGDVIIVDNSPSTLKPSFQITSTDAGSYGPVVQYKHSSASPSNTDLIFIGSYIGKNDADEDVTYMQDSVTLASVADGQETSKYNMNLVTNGTSRSALELISYTDNTIDATIAYGAGSSTTIAGDLTITGGNITNAITFDSGITNAGTIAAGTWQGTAINQTYLVGQSGTNTGDQTKASFDLDHLYTLVGAASDDAENLSTFTGSTIADDQTIKQALQALETAVELRLTNNSDNTMAGALTIDKNNSTASNGTTQGLYVDVDRTGNVSSGVDYVYGLNVDVDVSGSSNHVQLIYGMELDVTGDDMGSGSSQVIGLNLSASGADTNIGIFNNTVDGGTDYRQVSSADSGDHFSMATTANGVTTLATVDDDGAAAHLNIEADGHVKFDGCAAGFTRHEETFSTTDLKSTGGTDDTDIDFRVSNKIRLEMTGDIAQMNLVFPAVSGNFTMVCTTNGDHDVTAWKVWESDLSAATTTDVMWAGGSVPAFTSSGVDIVSFYWDATEQQCYGVCSLAFATP